MQCHHIIDSHPQDISYMQRTLKPVFEASTNESSLESVSRVPEIGICLLDCDYQSIAGKNLKKRAMRKEDGFDDEERL